MPVTDKNIAAMQDEYDAALATITPRQAWAVKINRQIETVVARRLDLLSPGELRNMRAAGILDQHVKDSYAEITASMMRHEAAVDEALNATEIGSSDYYQVRRQQASDQLAMHYPDHRLGDIFCQGAVTYAQVRHPTQLNFVVAVNGAQVEKVFR